jgi:tetratricopeptide (TPR) repeat protein
MQTKPRHHKNLFPLLFAILVIIVLAATSSARNRLWREDVPLWEDVARKAPGKARAYHVLGLAAYKGGEVDAAIGYFLTVLRIKPDYVHTYTNLAACYGSKGMHDKAIEYSYLALKIKPDFEEAYYSLGVAFASQGLLDKAREHLATALRIKPDHKEAQRLLQNISDKK